MDDADDAVADVLATLGALADLRPREHDTCVAWLLAELDAAAARSRPVQVAVLRERAKAAGWSWGAVLRARASLRVVGVRRPVECWRHPLARER